MEIFLTMKIGVDEAEDRNKNGIDENEFVACQIFEYMFSQIGAKCFCTRNSQYGM